MYRVTKRHAAGIETTEITSVEFEVGFKSKGGPWLGGPYEVTEVTEIECAECDGPCQAVTPGF